MPSADGVRQEARVGELVRCAAFCRCPSRLRSSNEVDAALNFRACAVLQAVVRCRVIMHHWVVLFSGPGCYLLNLSRALCLNLWLMVPPRLGH